MIQVVPGTGVEPVRLAARDFKSLVSTNFTIRARPWQPLHPRTPATGAKKGKADAFPFFIWSGRRVSNSRPQAWEAGALPTELLPLMGRILKHFRQFFTSGVEAVVRCGSDHTSAAFASAVRKINGPRLAWSNNFGRVIRMQTNGGSYHVRT